MSLELLPNELFFNLFEFFDTASLLRAFFGLNLRLNELVSIHFHNHQFNFQSISKDNFDLICPAHLPWMVDHISFLRLSNNQTPELCEFILSHHFSLDRFCSLQSLTLDCIHSLDTLVKLILSCRSLPYLTTLHLIKCDVEERQRCIIHLLNKIWSLPTLRHCNLNGIHLEFTSLVEISTISSSIENLWLENIPCDLYCVYHLFKCTPNLQQLAMTIYSYDFDENLPWTISLLQSLKVFFQGSIDLLKNLFSHLPQLSYLTIETSDLYLDGDEWKAILQDYLPRVKTFRLKMKFELLERNDQDVEDKIDQLLLTFRSTFWIEEHQWYVRCHWESSEITTCVILYTIPFAFNTIHYFVECQTKSSCAEEENTWSCSRVQSFENNDRKSLMFHHFTLVCVQFPNLRYLNIVLPFPNDFSLCNITLSHLTFLSVTILYTTAYCQLQRLLDHAPHLYSLQIISAKRSSIELFRLKHSSIRELDFLGNQRHWCNQFSRDECLALADSILGRQCEVLSIEIDDRLSLFALMQRMLNLRLINFRCQDDRSNSIRKSQYRGSELERWLQSHLSSTHSISRNPEISSCIQIWIDQQDKLTQSNPSLSKTRRQFVSHFFISLQKRFWKK